MTVVKISNVAGVSFIRSGFASENDAEVTTDLDEAISKIKAQPKYNHFFHAYGFALQNLNLEKITFMVAMAKETGFDLRVWQNDQNSMILFCFADPDTSEDSGFTLWESMQKIAYDHYGMPSAYEWEAYGLDVDPSASIVQTSERAVTIGEVGLLF
jgi:hypothetical protein